MFGMRTKLSPLKVMTFINLACIVPVFSQKSLDLNVGISASKSIIGLSYRQGDHEFNAGLRGFGYNSHDGLLLQPGVAYNRYFTENGFYASAIYIPTYRSNDSHEFTFNAGTNAWEYRITEEKGWHPGFFLVGLGKSFQFTRWGLHADAGGVTDATSQFGQSWGIYFGAAASYRFNLD